MPLYPLKKIGSLADGRQAYLRGVSGYNTGWVQGYTCAANAFYPEFITARVEEPAGTQRVEVGFDHTDEAEYLDCTCSQFRPGSGACKHIVAVLVHKYYKDMIEGLPTAADLMHQQAETDPAARQLIDQYMTRETVRLTAAEGGRPAVTLVPTLTVAGGRASVTFAVGSDHPYSIRNLAKFGEQMAAGETVTYGKQLTLLHHRSSFTPESLPLLDFLLAELSERQSLPGGFGLTGGVGELRLSPAGFDRFFSLLLGGTVLLRQGEDKRPVRLEEGRPTLTVTVQKEGTGLRLTGEETQPVSGTSTLYLLHRGVLYRTGADYTRRMAEWVRTVNRCPKGLYVAAEQLPAFCGGVLSAIRPYIRLQGEAELLDTYTPKPMQAAVYLDMPRENTVTARVEFRYGESRTADYATAEQPWQDPLAELRVRLVLQQYFTLYQPGGDLLLFEGDDDALFELMTVGVDRLRQVATVYTTDAMQAASLAVLPPLHIGVSLVDGLLEMHTDMEQIDPAELAGILAGYRDSRPYHRLKDGRFVQLDDVALVQLAELAEGLGITPKELQSGRISLPKYRALYLDRVLRGRENATRDRAFTGLVERFDNATHANYQVPATLQKVLRGYQRAGYRWLCTMEEMGFGGILADDMGLGKTLQMITLLLAAKEAGNTQPSLVVCPTSVVLGWEREIAKFAPQLSVLCVIGDAAERRRRLETAGQYDVVVTSYDMLKRDVAAYTAHTFRYHVLDEAQYIKNSSTQNARAVKTIKSAQRFALTGTPVENRLGELWSIFDFLMPGLLFSYQKFRNRYEIPISREEDGRTLLRLGRVVSPFILRRLKSEVLTELPPKTERVLPATMERAQRQVYLATMAQLREQLVGMGHHRPAGQQRVAVLAMLTRLRQLCCDPRLCCEGYTGDSCKLNACLELLREATAGGHKVLLFSQFTSMLALLRERLEEEGIRYYLLQGSTSKEERVRLVDAFNGDDTPVFLISLKAGGTGLNLTGADMVIHYDPWWNVAAQNQATDRAHRIGQKNPVQVVRLIARDTIEEKILQMQEAKQHLAQQVVEADAPGIGDLTAEELLALLE